MSAGPSSPPEFIDPLATPLLTAACPGTGGDVAESDDFVVEELPAYEPCGDGEHTFLWIEKRGLTTPQAVERLCRQLGAEPRGAGYAGLKDKRGVTRQWISLHGVDPALAGRMTPDEQLRVLDARRHGNKLRTGHLRGNRFTVTLRGVVADAAARARVVAAQISRCGLPNYYGAQRFGARGDNARWGWQVLHEQREPPRNKRTWRLVISALQAQLFNEALARRLRQGLLDELLDGDVLQKRDSGACFVSEQREVDAERLARGEVGLTGPICGPRMIRPRAGSAALRFEERVFADLDVAPDALGRWGRLARGGRRALLVHPEGLSVEELPDSALRLSFALPAGSYATVLLREICG